MIDPLSGMPVDTIEGPSAPRYVVGGDLRLTPLIEADVLVLGSGAAGFRRRWLLRIRAPRCS